jgi:uncharacterized protein (DUF58 family)
VIPKEILRKIRQIQITTSRMATDVFAGRYQSVFKGTGMEFYEVREYLPGDEIRSIDWNVTARTGHPYVKKFVEERELTVMLLLDASMSCRFGSAKQLKNQLAAELCSVLAFSALQNSDKVGLLIFTDKIEKFVPARKGLRHTLRVIREALYYKPEGRGTDIALALEYLSRLTRRKAVTFIISDFFSAGFKNRLSIANKRHDIIAVTITDPREIELPDVGMINLEDAETGQKLMVDTAGANFRKDYMRRALERIAQRRKLFRSINVDSIDVQTDRPYVQELIKFFKKRERKIGIR